MAKFQNLYDDPDFFKGYKKLRENPTCANAIEEKPALYSLIPDLTGKTVLDLGCGYGENCAHFVKLGAKSVVGIDISEKMLQIAKYENPEIPFVLLNMNDLSAINQPFDVIFSSLAVHYIQDFDSFIAAVFKLLSKDGYFIFSQEHPLNTAPIAGPCWVKDEQNHSIFYKLTDYGKEGERKTHWIIDDVVKYHRSFSTIINTLVENGFTINKVVEPIASEEILEKLPRYKKSLHKPQFLLIKAKK